MFMNTWGCCTIEDLQSDVSQYCIFVHPLSSIYLDVCFSGWSLEYQQTSVSSCSYCKGRYQWSHLPTAPWHPHLTHPPPPSCVPLLPLSKTSPHPITPSSNCLMKSFNNFQNMNPSIVIPLSSILQAQPSHQCLTEYLFISVTDFFIQLTPVHVHLSNLASIVETVFLLCPSSYRKS